jgi:hypothetical protein
VLCHYLLAGIKGHKHLINRKLKIERKCVFLILEDLFQYFLGGIKGNKIIIKQCIGNNEKIKCFSIIFSCYSIFWKDKWK